MSLKSLPLLFTNLGGEMIYILQQRLTAQSIDDAKAQKVLNEIVSTMFNGKFVEELFKPQDIYSKKAVRTVFDRLAHSSIMRLNAASMDKLYDLMVMAVKYQLSLIEHPRDILLVTLNHIDGMRSMVSGQQTLQHMDGIYRRVMQAYGSLQDGEFQLIRQTLLAFFQDAHVRVSIFLKEKQQTADGHFVLSTGGTLPHGTEVPGTIRYFDITGQPTHETTFDCSNCGPYNVATQRGSLAASGDRMTTLGTNLYSYTLAKPTDATAAGSDASRAVSSSAEGDGVAHDQTAKAQLDLLCHLIGATNSNSRQAGSFRLNLFSSTDEAEVNSSDSPREQDSPSLGSNVVNIDAANRPRNAQLAKIMGDLSVSTTANGKGSALDETEDNLLDLMDRA